MPSSGIGFFLTAPGQLERRSIETTPGPDEATVRVAGCGVCHTDISFYEGAVDTRHPLPLVLGHEVSGVVEAAGEEHTELVGQQVIVPAMIPCEKCPLCLVKRDSACHDQVMPGNHIHGGFASHLVVPAHALIPVGTDLGGHELAELAVIADAVTTPYQALRRAGVAAGDLVVIIGVGGIGTYGLQIATALDAVTVAVDVDATKLEHAKALGAKMTFDPRETDGRAIRKRLLRDSGISTHRWRILEMSGTAAGQETAWALLAPAATLGIIGFTMDRPSVRLSNLMALDATAFGSWGCSPRHYPAVLDLVVSGKVQVRPFVEQVPLERAPELLAEIHQDGSPARRPILVPN
ncbi:MAG: 6-hydroxycyclohex-1-ene-1-carbonyl-CoA dehydrogenase [Vicinamibacterales bacterium]|jgi:6-hydroxycyclohex-1-ene-1-carbonyl-CoA dehydrogenase|nr:6-hydroxycyclohex-1-ene-1-carbonyl-CoA dehydrogenase [Acidobacteriota bacterium]MDP7478790.1 6-hydroxycyclohex-1-ene-1-carbonyl-CoA dehydrogenase [Vicinamibacterales bacterium]MDP7670367.1 6-hydroxycyclohex-1-ene-1-carbonyl-CoA dehydrogenase [Vicinamibacterales bacterium]HJO38024.1 6-hydroxycyclohex-1-ene-1-carbonyl-CoA dehydrogenase [Vicinamibacterales bacterium]|tara:strand:+ start:2761 stop:3810 length:1050 start_codon:yes stop_codon:yes gene_type:complete